MIFNLIIPDHFWVNVLLDKKVVYFSLGHTSTHGE